MKGILWHIFKSTSFKIILGVFLFASGFLLYTSAYNENLFSNIVNMTVVPVQNAFFELHRSMDGIVYDFKSSQELKNENEELKAEIRQLREVTADYYDLKRKIIKYEKYFGFNQERDDLSFVSASVIGRDPSELFYGFTINLGTDSGISDGDSVITENGFVGYIAKAEKKSSKVKTIFSPDAKLGAADTVSGDMGIISGNAELCEQGLTGLTLVTSQNSLKEGNIITTTGLSGMYPKNLLIGKVKGINYDNVNFFHYAIIEPFEDIKKVKDVLVIIGFHGEGQISQSVVQ